MVSSDPLISSLQKISKKKSAPFRSDALQLLKEPDIASNNMPCLSSDEDFEEENDAP